jgi:hypothetical protein
MKLDHHGPQDHQSLLMHRAAVQMLLNNPNLAEKSLDALRRWDEIMDNRSKPLRDEWVKIIREKNWSLATEDSERGNQLRQASPLAILLPNSVRFEIIRTIKKMKAPTCAKPT